MAEVEKDYLREILAATKGNKSEAAKILGISRKNLYERLAREKEVRGQRSEVGGQTSEASEYEKSPVSDGNTSDL